MKNLKGYCLVSFIVFLIVFASFSAGLFSGLENFLEDRLFSNKPIHQDILIIAIDNESLSRLGQWPWPRGLFASALLKINQSRPAAVAFDVIFSEPSRLGPQDDYYLSNVLSSTFFPIVMPLEKIGPNFTRPLPQFTGRTALGYINTIQDKDGIVRNFPLRTENGVYSLGYSALKAAGKKIPQEQNLGEINRIVYAAPPRSVRAIPFWRLFEEDLSDQLSNKLIFIGATAPDLHDSRPTPLSKGEEMAGVEIHANIANMLIMGYRLRPLTSPLAYLWLLFAILMPVVFSLKLRSINSFVFASVGAGVLYLIAQIILFQQGIAANIIHIHLAWILSTIALVIFRYLIVDKEKREMRGVFGKYVSPEVLEQILQNPQKVALGGEEREITVLFSDIRGYTSLSEKTSPHQLVDIINRYFTSVTEEILKNDGVVDKYIGDAVMAFWGAPLSDPDHAEKALKASLGMIKKVEEFNQILKKEIGIEIAIGIGLYSGPAIVGNMGSSQRFDYTAIGDTVNVASRLESLNKEYQTSIIIGEPTVKKIKGAYQFKSLGSAQVKGRVEGINIFTVL